MIKHEDTRIYKLREYMFDVINIIVKNFDFKINVDMLLQEPDSYSLDKIPLKSTVEKWITGEKIKRDVYDFRSRCNYSSNEINNLKNIGFFEELEELIEFNDRNGILPDIVGIQNIECLNCGTMNNAETQTAEFSIQIQITYKLKVEEVEL